MAGKIVLRFIGAAALVAGLAGCAPPEPSVAASPTATASIAAAPAEKPTPALALPVSINAVMVALVDHASEPLWLDAYRAPKTTDGWHEAEYNAYQMAVSGKLIQVAGTGPNDSQWVVDPQWRKFADEMSMAGMDALGASQSKNVDALNKAGDRLVAACEDCHKKFKPDLTSMGLYKSPNYPPKK